MAQRQGMGRWRSGRGIGLAVLGLLCSVLWGACSGGGALDAPDSGRSTTYEPGLPSFDLEALATVRDGQPGVEAFVSIPRASLVFTASDSGYAARYDLTLQVEGAEGSASFASYSDTLTVASMEATRSYERIRHRERFGLAPGVYVVEAVLEDVETGEQAVRRQRVDVRGLTGEAWLSRPLLLADLQAGSAAAPVVALHVPARRDSLRVRVEAYDAPAGATLDLTLAELRADTSVAIPPFWISPSRGSLVYRGIDGGSADTLLARTEPLAGAAEQPVVFDLPTLESGSYLLDLRLRDASGATLDRKERSLSVKGVAFPRLATLAELADALDYIAYPREMEFITSGGTPQERRRRFDAFWGTLVSDRRVASNLLRLYYERVEEANLQFTSHKAGWKTDRGMIYVIFGAPGYVEETFDGEIWYYGYGEQDAASTFVFERADLFGDRSVPGHYVLVRQPVYERAWRRALDRWRRGAAL